MPEKTPRQIGKEAEALYAKHKLIAPELQGITEAVENYTSMAQHFHNLANAMESGEVAPEFEEFSVEENVQRRRGMRDEALATLGKSVLRQGELAKKSETNLHEATQHYEENAAAYHKLAVHEADMDGIHINVDQSRDTKEPSDNT